ncbi:MAG: hypothetical protein ACI85I_000293 [Arenicella sp.]|jgi:hypothetical protein
MRLPLFLTLLISFITINSASFAFSGEENTTKSEALAEYSKRLYKEIGFEETQLPLATFQKAMVGYYNMQDQLKKKEIITIMDFDQSSLNKRFFVVDLKNKKLLFQSIVAHGKNSGFDIPNKFSNTHQSLQSSLGFYKTAETYLGHFGYALRLDGIEKGFNSNARGRGIVMHGAKYVTEAFGKAQGRMGRSYGCPALPYTIHKQVIDVIKGGSMLYIHKNQEDYLTKSILQNADKAGKAFAEALQNSQPELLVKK